MKIEAMKEEIGQYERYLSGLKSSEATQLVLRSLARVSGKVTMIMSGIDHELGVAFTKKDAKRIEELNKLSARAKAMFEGYVNLAKAMGVKFEEPATAQRGG